ncbi:hypothetical protein PPSIR1_20669 [Plesiocystis pacifica SIR-1]|uniref:VWFA domain-containing protein n=1 Tax=Plesiocystis pacifica SIR-1 TaxID=391625 RepID=A6G2B0_9BACT|nr:hypothetical protein [Plesiocystis pacifica]EDM80079.1 hypothetical protein PPSIR1_20669 [Plesiocystis pacifica SIR-1]
MVELSPWKTRALVGLSLLAFGACGGDDGGSIYADSGSAEGSSSGDDSEEAGMDGDEARESSEGEDGDAESSSSDDGPLLDVLGGDTTATAEAGRDPGCEKVDFLFVIDNSGSMTEEQMALVTSFPGFISTISDTLMAQDYHLLVTDTDAASVGSSSISLINGELQCEPHPSCCAGACNGLGGVIVNPPPTMCNGEPCADHPIPEGCDHEIGAGKLNDQLGDPCGIDGELRYMLDDQTDLEQTFSCLALVGVGGDGLERPIDATLEAIGNQSSPGGCNEGFLRDDAVLVVTIISDEDDVGQSMGDPASWKQALVDAKGGNEEAVVILGLLGDGGLANGQCPDDVDAPALRSFTDSFVHGVVGSVCAPDYAPFFLQAVSVIDAACDDFEPVG